ncbi:hypothetical protein GCM10010468_23020 [Actinocorallia longicatena]|uniref:Uncharacterized protein n=1 Tax=Actinocorallia longicatena TaxID=111803 RepID=A0ABP6Q9Z3_9ACTN
MPSEWESVCGKPLTCPGRDRFCYDPVKRGAILFIDFAEDSEGIEFVVAASLYKFLVFLLEAELEILAGPFAGIFFEM